MYEDEGNQLILEMILVLDFSLLPRGLNVWLTLPEYVSSFLHQLFHSDYRQLKNTFGPVSVAKNHGDQNEIIFKAEITSLHEILRDTQS